MTRLNSRVRVSFVASLSILGAFVGATYGSVASAMVDSEFMAKVANANPEIPAEALKIAYQYLTRHEEVFTNQDYMTVIDFDQPSNVKRMYIIDLRSGAVERDYVAHGSGSGEKYATSFSNEPRSNMTSLGVYKTDGIYYGKHGRSLRVKGLQSTNSNAERRAVVIHEAEYMRPSAIRGMGRAGRSWGCFAVDPDIKNEIIAKLEGGALILAYHKGMKSEEASN